MDHNELEKMLNCPDVESDFPIITVDYEEFKPETYNGIIIIDHEGEKTKVNSGDFLKDLRYIQMEYGGFFSSGSVNNYIEDAKIKLK